MIDPKELRIRNWVTTDNPIAWPEMANIPVMVTSVEESLDEQFPESPGAIRLKYEHDTYCQYSEFISPIPLTPEWLERLGFEYDKYMLWWTNKKVSIFNAIRTTNNKDFFVVSCYGQTKPIRSVHDLQNLIFCLTGEEL